MFGGARVATGTVPVPVSGTVCGLLVALSATLTLADRPPVAVGLKVTPTPQLNPAPSELAPSGQAVPLVGAPRLKSPGLVPVGVMPVIFSVAEPLFVMVTLFVALDVLTFWFPKATLMGLNEMPGPLTALNVRWKLVVPPSPSTDDTMKKYGVPEFTGTDRTCDCAMPAAAFWLHATCVPVGEPLVTLSIVSYGLVSVSAAIVPLLDGVNVYQTLFA